MRRPVNRRVSPTLPTSVESDNSAKWWELIYTYVQVFTAAMLRITTSVLTRRPCRYNGVSNRCMPSFQFCSLARSRQTIVLPSRLSLLILLTSQSFAYFLLIPVCDQPATILCPNAFLNRTSLISMETMSISVIGLRSGPARVGAALGRQINSICGDIV